MEIKKIMIPIVLGLLIASCNDEGLSSPHRQPRRDYFKSAGRMFPMLGPSKWEYQIDTVGADSQFHFAGTQKVLVTNRLLFNHTQVPLSGLYFYEVSFLNKNTVLIDTAYYLNGETTLLWTSDGDTWFDYEFYNDSAIAFLQGKNNWQRIQNDKRELITTPAGHFKAVSVSSQYFRSPVLDIFQTYFAEDVGIVYETIDLNFLNSQKKRTIRRILTSFQLYK